MSALVTTWDQGDKASVTTSSFTLIFGSRAALHAPEAEVGTRTCVAGWNGDCMTLMATEESRELQNQSSNIGALTSRIGFWGILYYNQKKEPQNSTKGLVIF